MISEQDIKQLRRYTPDSDSCILSLYLNVDQSNAANLNRGFETSFESLCRQVLDNQDSDQAGRQRFEAECRLIRQFLRDYVPKGKTLVVFSDSKKSFWWQRDLQVALPSGLRWSQKPWVRPLLELVEGHDRLAVVLIDKQRARIFAGDTGEIEQQLEILSNVPNRHSTTGSDHIMSQGQMERDHDNHVQSHAKRTADELSSLIERLKLEKVVIGGPVEATSVFIGSLPKRIQQMVIGTISAPVEAGTDRVINEVRDVQDKAEQEDEAKIVDAMITAAMKGEKAVLGLSDTLFAIQEGRVYRLVVARDYRAEGKECGSCHVLIADGLDNCSFCGGKLDAAPDLINRASHRVLDMGGKIQLVAGEAAAKLAGARIGALLRF
jgi:peptide subunit release factor 1 (eRF1)